MSTPTEVSVVTRVTVSEKESGKPLGQAAVGDTSRANSEGIVSIHKISSGRCEAEPIDMLYKDGYWYMMGKDPMTGATTFSSRVKYLLNV